MSIVGSKMDVARGEGLGLHDYDLGHQQIFTQGFRILAPSYSLVVCKLTPATSTSWRRFCDRGFGSAPYALKTFSVVTYQKSKFDNFTERLS